MSVDVVDPHTLHATLQSDPAEIAAIRHRVEAFVLQGGLGKEAADAVGLSVNEALANVIRHAYAGSPGKPIEITVQLDSRRELVVLIRDWGSGVVPRRRDCRESQEIRPGGLGIPCMEKTMDCVEFFPQPDGMLLKMTRRRR